MASSGIHLTRPPQLDRFLHATIGTEHNGMDLSVLSVLARLGKDPWTEAARLAGLPRAAAADSLAATISGLPAECRPQAHARMVALCLVPFLPDQARPVPDTMAASTYRNDRRTVTLLAGATLSAALALGLLTGATICAVSQKAPPDVTSGTTAVGRPSPVEQTSWPSPSGPWAP